MVAGTFSWEGLLGEQGFEGCGDGELVVDDVSLKIIITLESSAHTCHLKPETG